MNSEVIWALVNSEAPVNAIFLFSRNFSGPVNNWGSVCKIRGFNLAWRANTEKRNTLALIFLGGLSSDGALGSNTDYNRKEVYGF